MGKFLTHTAVVMAVFIAFGAATPALADDDNATMVHLDVTERTEVIQNLLVASLRYQTEGADARTVQNDINSAMAKALRAAKSQRDVEVQTGHYNVQPTYEYRTRNGNRERVLTGWRGSQSLRLESERAAGVLTAVRDLQNMGLAINNLSYQVTRELRESTRNSLLENAVAKLRVKAQRVASALGKNNIAFKEIQVGRGKPAPTPRPMMARAELAGAKMETPVADPGDTTITLTVSAKVLIN